MEERTHRSPMVRETSRMAILTDEHREIGLAHLNEICPDTFDEGEFGPWTFTSLGRKDDAWTLEFDNSAGSDLVEFTYAGGVVDDGGGVSHDWFEQVSAAIQTWESTARGDDMGDDDMGDEGE